MRTPEIDPADSNKAANVSPMILFEGQSGCGKSTLTAYAVHLAQQLQMTVASTAARESRARQPFFLWRAVVCALFPLQQLEMGPLLEDADMKVLPHLLAALQLDGSQEAAAAGSSGRPNKDVPAERTTAGESRERRRSVATGGDSAAIEAAQAAADMYSGNAPDDVDGRRRSVMSASTSLNNDQGLQLGLMPQALPPSRKGSHSVHGQESTAGLPRSNSMIRGGGGPARRQSMRWVQAEVLAAALDALATSEAAAGADDPVMPTSAGRRPSVANVQRTSVHIFRHSVTISPVAGQLPPLLRKDSVPRGLIEAFGVGSRRNSHVQLDGDAGLANSLAHAALIDIAAIAKNRRGSGNRRGSLVAALRGVAPAAIADQLQLAPVDKYGDDGEGVERAVGGRSGDSNPGEDRSLEPPGAQVQLQPQPARGVAMVNPFTDGGADRTRDPPAAAALIPLPTAATGPPLPSLALPLQPQAGGSGSSQLRSPDLRNRRQLPPLITGNVSSTPPPAAGSISGGFATVEMEVSPAQKQPGAAGGAAVTPPLAPALQVVSEGSQTRRQSVGAPANVSGRGVPARAELQLPPAPLVPNARRMSSASVLSLSPSTVGDADAGAPAGHGAGRRGSNASALGLGSASYGRHRRGTGSTSMRRSASGRSLLEAIGSLNVSGAGKRKSVRILTGSGNGDPERGRDRPPAITVAVPKADPSSPDVSPEWISQQVRALLVKLVVKRAATGLPILLCFEDVQHADAASLNALLDLAEQLDDCTAAERRIAVVVSCRPSEPNTPTGRCIARLHENHPCCERFELGALTEAEAETLICHTIGAARVPRALRDFICSQTDAVPFLIVDLARALLEDGSVQVDTTGSCYVNRALRRLKPSDGARTAFIAKLDKLTAAQAMTLKLSAVIGVRFAVGELLAIHPGGIATFFGGGDASDSLLPETVEHEAIAAAATLPSAKAPAATAGRARPPRSNVSPIDEQLRVLVTLSILREVEHEESSLRALETWADLEEAAPAYASRREYEFVQPRMQEVVYSLLPVRERRALHLKLARYHEERLGGRDARDAGVLALLAHHFLLADAREEACRYLDVCATMAFESHSNLEAARLYEDLLKNTAAPMLKRARWLRCSAEVHARLEMHHEAIDLCRKGLEVLGRPVPGLNHVHRMKLSISMGFVALRLQALPNDGEYLERAALASWKSRAFSADGVGHGHAHDADSDHYAAIDIAMSLYATMSWSANLMLSQPTLLVYCLIQLARMSMDHPRLSEAAARGLAVQASLAAFANRREAAMRWASLACQVAAEVGSSEVWDSLILPLGLALVAAMDFSTATAACASWQVQAAQTHSARQSIMTVLIRVILSMRSSRPLGEPDELRAVAERLKACMGNAAKNPDLLDNFHLTMGNIALSRVLLLLDDHEEAKECLESHLHSRFSGGLSVHFLVLMGAAHADALWRCRGLEARSWDGRTAVRIALDVIELAGHRDVPPRLVYLADLVLQSSLVVFLGLLAEEQQQRQAGIWPDAVERTTGGGCNMLCFAGGGKPAGSALRRVAALLLPCFAGASPNAGKPTPAISSRTRTEHVFGASLTPQTRRQSLQPPRASASSMALPPRASILTSTPVPRNANPFATIRNRRSGSLASSFQEQAYATTRRAGGGDGANRRHSVQSSSSALSGLAPAPPTPDELRAGLAAAARVLKAKRSGLPVVRPVESTLEGLARSARGDLSGAARLFARAAREARAGRQLRDAGLALLLQAAHAGEPAARARLAREAQAALEGTGDRYLLRAAQRLAAACGPAGDVDGAGDGADDAPAGLASLATSAAAGQQ